MALELIRKGVRGVQVLEGGWQAWLDAVPFAGLPDLQQDKAALRK
ncbi:MAG: hypothetical protein AB1640_13380 [bacterium]